MLLFTDSSFNALHILSTSQLYFHSLFSPSKIGHEPICSIYCKMFLFLDHYSSHCTQSLVTFTIHFDSLHNTVIFYFSYVSYRIISYHIIYRITSYRVVSCRVVSCRIVSYCIVSFRIIYFPSVNP